MHMMLGAHVLISIAYTLSNTNTTLYIALRPLETMEYNLIFDDRHYACFLCYIIN